MLSVIRRLAREGMTMVIVTHEMDFARDVSNRVFYMDEGLIYEQGPPSQIFDNPLREKTSAFINRVRSYRAHIGSPDFDLYALNAEIEAFCEKHIVPREARGNLMLLVEEVLQLHKPWLARGTLDLTVSYSEKSGQLELDCECSGDAGNQLHPDEGEDGLEAMIIRAQCERIDYRLVDGRSRLEFLVKKD